MMVLLLGQLPAFFTNGAFAAVLLCVGLAIGLAIGKRNDRKPDAEGVEAKELAGMLGHLVGWTQSVADDMSEYRSVMRGVAELFQDTDRPLDDHQRRATAGLLSQVVEANEQLQNRLNSAETMLKQQTTEISTYMSEARTDQLTSLPNRRAFDEDLARRLAEWVRYGRPLSVVMADIDHFKQFNDKYGHQTGDEVLKKVADLLRETMRESDLVARFGGEEMSVVLAGTDEEEACLAAERARRAIEKARFHFDGEPLSVTISLGSAQCLAGETGTQLVKRADEALYAAKQAGRNRTYQHDGHHCVPVGNPADAPRQSDPLPGKSPQAIGPATSPTAASFAEVCQDLRQRLEEVAGGTGS